MVLLRNAVVALAITVLAFSAAAFGQAKPGEGSPTQRLEVLRQKLETIRRSATSAASVLKDEGKDEKADKNAKESLDSPASRLHAIEK